MPNNVFHKVSAATLRVGAIEMTGVTIDRMEIPVETVEVVAATTAGTAKAWEEKLARLDENTTAVEQVADAVRPLAPEPMAPEVRGMRLPDPPPPPPSAPSAPEEPKADPWGLAPPGAPAEEPQALAPLPEKRPLVIVPPVVALPADMNQLADAPPKVTRVRKSKAATSTKAELPDEPVPGGPWPVPKHVMESRDWKELATFLRTRGYTNLDEMESAAVDVIGDEHPLIRATAGNQVRGKLEAALRELGEVEMITPDPTQGTAADPTPPAEEDGLSLDATPYMEARSIRNVVKMLIAEGVTDEETVYLAVQRLREAKVPCLEKIATNNLQEKFNLAWVSQMGAGA